MLKLPTNPFIGHTNKMTTTTQSVALSSLIDPELYLKSYDANYVNCPSAAFVDSVGELLTELAPTFGYFKTIDNNGTKVLGEYRTPTFVAIQSENYTGFALRAGDQLIPWSHFLTKLNAKVTAVKDKELEDGRCVVTMSVKCTLKSQAVTLEFVVFTPEATEDAFERNTRISKNLPNAEDLYLFEPTTKNFVRLKDLPPANYRVESATYNPVSDTSRYEDISLKLRGVDGLVTCNQSALLTVAKQQPRVFAMIGKPGIVTTLLYTDRKVKGSKTYLTVGFAFAREAD
jgi:hypothetical protein